MPQVSVRPAHAPHQPPAASLSEPPSFPPAVPAATGQLSRSRMRPPAVAARTVCGLGGWYVRRGPRGPQLPGVARRGDLPRRRAGGRARRRPLGAPRQPAHPAGARLRAHAAPAAGEGGPVRMAVRAVCARRAGTRPLHAGWSPGRLSGVARACVVQFGGTERFFATADDRKLKATCEPALFVMPLA